MSELTLFDYASLPINDAMELNAIKERIKVRLKRTAEDIIEIGKDLIIAKEKCGHGGFEKWLKAEFEFSQMTATKFMNVALEFGDKTKLSLDLTPSILYALSAPSTPEEVREIVIEKIESGEKVDLKEIERLKKEATDLLAEKQAIQNDLIAKTQRLDEAVAKVQFQALTVEAVTKQNDELRNRDQALIDAKVAEAKAQLILENQQAIADAKRERNNAQSELERLKKERDTQIKNGIEKGLQDLDSEIRQKQNAIDYQKTEIEKLSQIKREIDVEVGALAIHKKAIERIKDNLGFLTVSFSDAFDTNTIPVEVAGEWDAIFFALSKLKTQMSDWRDRLAPLENTALVGELL